jgi:conjugal transfer ATP-binding protein TraC
MEKIAILKVKPINFQILNNKEKEAITQTFQKFLNSLDFPIQILMTTTKLELEGYFSILEERVKETVKKTGNRIYKKNLKSYKEHIETVIEENKVMNRNFYIIIKEASVIDLSIQVSIVQEKLDNLKIKSERLRDFEIKEFLIDFFNEEYKDKEPEGVIDKDLLMHYLIAPKKIKNFRDYLDVDNKLNKIISAKGYPRMVEPGFLDKIITTAGNFDLSIHIEPYSIESTMVMLNKQLQKQRADLYSAELKKTVNPSLEIKYKDTRNVLENLQKGQEKLFNVSLYINCKADNLEDLNLLTKKIQSELNSIMIIPSIPNFRMVQGLKSTTPFACDELKIKRNITTKALSAFFPFTSRFLEIDDSGIWFGSNKNNIPIIKDIFKFTNPNGCILATSGSGKSFFSKLLISRQLLNGTKVMVIDPQSEYVKLVEKFNGQVVNISKESKTIINPLDLMGHDYAEKRLSLMDLLNVMLGELSEPQKAVMDKALTKTYTKKGITNDDKTWNYKPPILQDLLKELEIMGKRTTTIERPTYQSLINRLSMYVDGVFSFMNTHTKLNFDNRFVCFNIGEMPKQVKPVIMFLILDYVYAKMRKDLDRKLLVIDEAWSLLSRAEDAGYIFEIVKTSRKFNLGLLLLTQDVADLLGSKAGNAVLANSSYTFLMKQKPSVIDSVVKTFQLSSNERNKLLTSLVGEGVLITENDHTELKVIASEEEHEVITTNPDEILNGGKKEEVGIEKDVKINVDEDERFFRKKDISEDELIYLVNNGYTLSSHVNLLGGRQEDFLLKPNENESEAHFFLIKAIEEHLQRYTKSVKLFNTTKPDIVFKDKEGEIWAIEIETGSKKDKKMLEDKVKTLNKNLGERWFFVVTDKKVKKKYEKYGETLTRFDVSERLASLFNQPKNPKRGAK